ncbi:MAG: flagellar hook-length control protein FliK [Deltaproteobacteria bacterium]|jgi:hypothetical protein|nr:flagellar hook-length control protein FliK [Deltaproteobacteria bacterium]
MQTIPNNIVTIKANSSSVWLQQTQKISEGETLKFVVAAQADDSELGTINYKNQIIQAKLPNNLTAGDIIQAKVEITAGEVVLKIIDIQKAIIPKNEVANNLEFKIEKELNYFLQNTLKNIFNNTQQSLKIQTPLLELLKNNPQLNKILAQLEITANQIQSSEVAQPQPETNKSQIQTLISELEKNILAATNGQQARLLTQFKAALNSIPVKSLLTTPETPQTPLQIQPLIQETTKNIITLLRHISAANTDNPANKIATANYLQNIAEKLNQLPTKIQALILNEVIKEVSNTAVTKQDINLKTILTTQLKEIFEPIKQYSSPQTTLTQSNTLTETSPKTFMFHEPATSLLKSSSTLPTTTTSHSQKLEKFLNSVSYEIIKNLTPNLPLSTKNHVSPLKTQIPQLNHLLAQESLTPELLGQRHEPKPNTNLTRLDDLAASQKVQPQLLATALKLNSSNSTQPKEIKVNLHLDKIQEQFEKNLSLLKNNLDQNLLANSPTHQELDIQPLINKVEQLIVTQNTTLNLNPMLQAAGEPALILFPFLLHGLLANANIFVNQDQDANAQQFEDSATSNSKIPFQKIQVTLPLPNLGLVEINIAYRQAEMWLNLTAEQQEVINFLATQTPLLKSILEANGFKDIEIQTTCDKITSQELPLTSSPTPSILA